MFNNKPRSWIDLEADISRKFNYTFFLLGIFLSFLIGGVALLQPPLLKRIQLSFYDIQISRLDELPSPMVPLVIDIDESSLNQYGQWPWPRYRLALLIEKLQVLGVKVISLDMVLAEKDRTSPITLKQTIEKDLNISFPLHNIPEKLMDNDLILAESFRAGKVVVGGFFYFSSKSNLSKRDPHTSSILFRKKEGDLGNSLFEAQSIVANIPILAEAASGTGFFNAQPDIDGILRKVPLLIKYHDKTYPSLALETTLQYLGVESLIVEENEDGYLLHLPDGKVALDKYANLYVRFGKGKEVTYFSAADVLQDKVEAHHFTDRIAFLGSTAVGINDIRSTPTDPLRPGVEMHAMITDNLLKGEFLRKPGWAVPFECIVAIVTGIIFSWVILQSGPYIGIVLLFGGGLLLTFVSQLILSKTGYVLSPIPALFAMFVILTILSSLKYWQEQFLYKKRTRQYQASQEATIEGFGALAEYRDPETGGHIKRTQHYVKFLAEKLSSHDRFKSQLNEAVIDILFKAAPLHDIGKVGVADSILLKPGPLDEQEFSEMKQHTNYGAEIFKAIENKVGHSPFLKIAREIANFHQEKWDGSGYPEGLSGDAIPFPARLMALADVYDALISERVYKPPFSHEMAKQMIISGRGNHFDPDIVDAFLELEETFMKIALENADSDKQRTTLLSKEMSQDGVPWSDLH